MNDLEHTEAVGEDIPIGPGGVDAAATGLDPRIEDCLDRFFAPLVESVPYEVRLERRAEMRAHLEAAARAHEELGSTREEAIAAAAQHLGRQADLGHLAARTPAVSVASARAATGVSVLAFGLPWLADNTRVAGHLWERVFGPGADAAYYRIALLVVPALAGLLVGLLCRKAMRGVLNGLALVAIVALVFPALAWGLGFMGVWKEGVEASWIPTPIPAMVGLPYWAIIGCAGAALGQRLRRARRAHRRPWLHVEGSTGTPGG
jgi:hypothetical protein